MPSVDHQGLSTIVTHHLVIERATASAQAWCQSFQRRGLPTTSFNFEFSGQNFLTGSLSPQQVGQNWSPVLGDDSTSTHTFVACFLNQGDEIVHYRLY